MMGIYWDLFFVFFKIGLFSFGGGLAMVSVIQQEVLAHGWIPAAEYARIITISQMTPGPIAVNTATYVGARVCGPDFVPAFMGSFIATLGVSLPSFIIVYFVARSLEKFSQSRLVVRHPPGGYCLYDYGGNFLFGYYRFPDRQCHQ